MAGSAPTGYRAALGSVTVRRLWLASLASTVGDYIGLGALLFLAADRTGLAVGTAAVLAVGIVPSLLTGFIGGRWLDRFHRGRTLAVLQVLGAGVICLPVFVSGAPIVFVTAALLSAVRIATIAVRSGAMAEGVHDDHRGPLVALLNSTEQASQVLGYLAGGTLYVTVGVEAALLIDAATFLVGAAVLAGMRLPGPDERAPSPRLTAGLTDLLRDPVLRLLAALVVLTGTVASLPEVLAPSVAAAGDPLRPFVLAAAPAGQAAAMTILGRLPQIRRPSVQIIHLGSLGVALVIAAFAPSAATVAAANVLVGAGTAWIVGPQLTFLRLAPKVRMAQITGTMVAGLAVAEGLGSLGFAALADLAGVGSAYGSAGVVILLGAAVGWRVRRRTPSALALDRDEFPDGPLPGAG